MSEDKNTDGTIIEFLLGSHSYNGYWFMDEIPAGTPRFWWRRILREHLAAASPVSDAVEFLDSIRDYERENGQQICYDERTSKELYEIFKPQSSPDTSVQEQDEPPCHICGGKTVLIRGKYPGTDKRNVCPQCTTERLEQIREISSHNYGRTSKA